jgi:hypothetical protein
MVRVKDLILVACLMVAATVTTAEVELWRLVPNQKSNFSLLPRVYLEGLSAQDLVREDARAVSNALNHAQGGWHAGVEPRSPILEVPNRILTFISKLTTYQYIALEIVFCLVDFGTIALLIVLGRNIKRRRLLKYLDRFHTKEWDGAAPALPLGSPRRRAAKIFLLAQCVVIGLLLVGILQLLQASSTQ